MFKDFLHNLFYSKIMITPKRTYIVGDESMGQGRKNV